MRCYDDIPLRLLKNYLCLFWIKCRCNICCIICVIYRFKGLGCYKIRGEVVSIFRIALRKSIHWVRSTVDGVDFPCLSVEQSRRLWKEFLEIEIGDAVELLDGKKSLILDEFDYAIFKEIWGTKKNLHSYFIILIPKVHNPYSIDEFHLISLLGSLYKFFFWQKGVYISC